MAIIGIVAIDRNLAIGKDGKLPWHYSADMKFFKDTTVGHAVVMGRRTWSTLKGPLKDRTNFVLSAGGNLTNANGIIVVNTMEDLLGRAKDLDGHLFVIGGAKVYEALLPHIERWIVTEIPLNVAEADTFMPVNFLDGYELYEMRQLDDGLRVKFYERSGSAA